MAFPTVPITTTNLDSGTDDPSLARADIYNAVVALNTIISEAGQALGCALLNSSGQIPTANMPNTIIVSGDMTLQSATTKIVIQDVLRLGSFTTADVNLIASPAAGEIVYCTDGNTGSPCLAVYDGSAWKRVALGATISAT